MVHVPQVELWRPPVSNGKNKSVHFFIICLLCIFDVAHTCGTGRSKYFLRWYAVYCSSNALWYRAEVSKLPNTTYYYL